MARFVYQSLLFLAFSVAFSGAAWACNLDVSARGDGVADYVETVRPCLTKMPEGYRADRKMEREFLDKINAERTARGLNALTLRPELMDVVRFHSLDMSANDFFEHESLDKRLPSHRIAAFDRRAILEYSSENVAMLEIEYPSTKMPNVTFAPYDWSDTMGRLHQGLMDSEGHRRNILNTSATHAAVGVVRTENGVWVTQVFVELAGTLPSDAPLRVRAGEPVVRQPYLPEWTFKQFEAERPNKAAEGLSLQRGAVVIGADFVGDIGLAVFVERPGPKPNSRVTTHLAGPDITVIPGTVG